MVSIVLGAMFSNLEDTRTEFQCPSLQRCVHTVVRIVEENERKKPLLTCEFATASTRVRRVVGGVIFWESHEEAFWRG